MINSNSVEVICYGTLTRFKSRKIAREFYLECMLCSEGSEHERYSKIVGQIMSSGNDTKLFYDEDDLMIKSIGKFEDGYVKDKITLDKWMTYNEYKRMCN